MVEVIVKSDVKDPLGPEIKVPLTVLKVVKEAIEGLANDAWFQCSEGEGFNIKDYLTDEQYGAYMILRDRINRAKEFKA